MSTVKVDLSTVLTLVGDMQRRMEKIDGRRVPGNITGRERSAALAEISKELLFLSHLCDKVRVATLDQYHATRGFVLDPS